MVHVLTPILLEIGKLKCCLCGSISLGFGHSISENNVWWKPDLQWRVVIGGFLNLDMLHR